MISAFKTYAVLSRLLRAGLVLIPCGLLATVALAQTFDDVEAAVTQGSQFNDALAETDATSSIDGVTGDVIDGEAGVFLLKRNKIFSAAAVVGAGYTDNPGRTLDINADPSATITFAATAGVNTRIDQRFDAGANVLVSGTEYTRDGAPDSRNVISTAYIGTPVLDGQFYTSLGASFGYALDGRFQNSTSFYGVTANVTTSRKIAHNVIVSPEISVSRQWSEASEQKNTDITAGAQAIWAPEAKWRVTGSVSYTHRVYDDFYERFTFVERKDDVWRAGVNVSRAITPTVAISASLSYTDQDSAFFLSNFASLDGGISARIVKRF